MNTPISKDIRVIVVLLGVDLVRQLGFLLLKLPSGASSGTLIVSSQSDIPLLEQQKNQLFQSKKLILPELDPLPPFLSPT